MAISCVISAKSPSMNCDRTDLATIGAAPNLPLTTTPDPPSATTPPSFSSEYSITSSGACAEMAACRASGQVAFGRRAKAERRGCG
jgi:hypothetical protein